MSGDPTGASADPTGASRDPDDGGVDPRWRPDRRRVLGALAAGAAWTAPAIVSAPAAAASTGPGGPPPDPPLPPGPLLDVDPDLAPIDRVVVVMMENRSFDHWLGWLGSDPGYLAAGQARYGPGFAVDGVVTTTYPSPGGPVVTRWMGDLLAGGNVYRGCGHPDPGHSWNAGRAQRDGGFLAAGSGNDSYALGYYLPTDTPVTAQLARRFCVCDRSFASLLGPTYPNRAYALSAQSGGIKSNTLPSSGYGWETIVERLAAAGVSVRNYASDIPMTLLFGNRMLPFCASIDDYYADCAAGTLPQVSFVDPLFLGEDNSDNHPHGDIRAGERFVRDVFAAFARSTHWRRGLFVLTYDEWGGFFDHVAPAHFTDDRASAVDANDFGQGGFRVPTLLASPYCRRGDVDHRTYDHTSVMRFLQWRFLGAPPEGPGGSGWYLTSRDRYANNIGAPLTTVADTALDIDLDIAVGDPSPPCGTAGGGAAPATGAVGGPGAADPDSRGSVVASSQGYFAQFGF